MMVPAYVMLRQQGGAIGLAVASSLAIMVYVMLLGWLQRRRFEREAAARGTSLVGVRGMLGAASRLAVAAAIATGLGLLARAQLLQWLPDMRVTTVLLRGLLLCTLGIGAYAVFARALGVRELAEIQEILLRTLRLRQRSEHSPPTVA